MSDNVSFEFDFSKIEKEFEKMGKDIEKVEKKATKKAINEAVLPKLKKNIGRSNINKKDYTHMQDDIKVSNLKEDKETLDDIREVKGGKKTGWKWTVREFGKSDKKGDSFVTKTVEETKDEVKDIIDNEIQNELKL